MLFGTLRQMVDDGRTVIFISHKLNEVTEVSDNVTVLRGGQVGGDGRDGGCDAPDRSRRSWSAGSSPTRPASRARPRATRCSSSTTSGSPAPDRDRPLAVCR